MPKGYKKIQTNEGRVQALRKTIAQLNHVAGVLITYGFQIHLEFGSEEKEMDIRQLKNVRLTEPGTDHNLDFEIS